MKNHISLRKSIIYKICLLTIALFFSLQSMWSQQKSIAYCDSLIKLGANAILEEVNYMKGLEYLEEARILSEQKQWHRQQFLVLNNIGIRHHMMFDYGEALNYYLEAYKISLKHLEDQETMIVLNNIAILYSKEKNYAKALEYFERAYRMAKKNNDFLKVGFYSINLGITCTKTGQLDLAETYLEEALQYVAEMPDKVLEAEGAMLEISLLKGQYIATINKGKQLLPVLTASKHTVLKNEVLLILAKAYSHQHDFYNSLHYIEEALANEPDIENKIEFYSLLSDLYYKNGMYQKALSYKDSILVAHDSLNQIRNGRLFENSKIKFELQNYQHELSLKETQIASERKLFYAILGIISILLASFFIWLHNRLIKQRQKKKIEESKRKIIELELEKERNENLLLEKQIQEKETIALLEQERLKNEIELRNRQLSAKALSLSSRDQLLEELINSLSQYTNLTPDRSLSVHLRKLKEQLNSEKEWKEFVTHFEEVNQGVLSTLKQKHPDLNMNDIRFISYIYMNLSTKEIASILNITQDACRKRKERITKKMSLEGENSLYNYLFSMEKV